MKKLTSLLLFMLCLNLANAQKVKVTETTEVIDKISRTGLSTIIEVDNKIVEKGWEKQLKTYGKYDYSKGVYSIPLANISAVSSTPCVVTSIIKKSGKGIMVWWAIDMGKDHVSQSGSPSAYKAAEKILYDFAIQCYRDDKNEQIVEAEKAVGTAVKMQEKEIKEGQDLVKDVEDNKQEKLNLEQKLKDNAAELVKLQNDIEQNKKDQATAAENVEKVKKALEMKKQELANIGK